MSDHGVATGPDTVRIERVLPGPIERVWAYLTEPEKRRRWLAGGAMELREGGRVELAFRHSELSAEATPEKHRQSEGGPPVAGRVLRCDPPHLLAYTWGEGGRFESDVTFELSASGDGVLLVVTHRRLPDRTQMVSVASGWDAHLGILADRLNGVEPRPFWSTYARLEGEYGERMGGSAES